MNTARLLVLALALAACASRVEKEAAADGRAAAAREIAEGRPCLLGIGLVSPENSVLDRETGLPRYSVGCVYDDKTVAYTGAHDGAILEALRAGRLRGMTFEDRWMTAEEAAARFEREKGVLLSLGDAPVEAQGGRFRVEIAPRNNRGHMDPYLFVLDAAGGRRELHFLGGTAARVLFAHDGRTLLIRDDVHRWYRTFDLARAIDLQAFPDPRD